MKSIFKMLPLVAAFIAPVASANTVFSDNFDANTLGLNSTPSGWSVTDGTVDLIGKDTNNNTSFDLVPGNGIYVDLDGSTGRSGLLSIGLNLDANVDYIASFSLAGSRRGSDETVTVDFGANQMVISGIPSDYGFSIFSLAFTPTASGTYALSFRNSGGDNVGALLDNVSVTGASPVPLPAAAWLLGPTLLGLGRRKSKSVGA